jgi:uncharacterized protein YbjQ (UPF0145 family)
MNIQTSNLEHIPGTKIIRHLGLVMGSTIRARHVGHDIIAGLRNVVGGEIREYTELLIQARNEAIQRMLKQAKERGANAVVNIRLSTSSVMQAAAEVFAYGTAVVIEKVSDELLEMRG